MEEDLIDLNLDDLEDDPIVRINEIGEDDDEFRLCLVGRVLTNSSIHFPSLRNVLSELRHPIKGVTITEIKAKRILFRLYNEVDLKRLMDEIPWFFNSHLIVFHKLLRGEDPLTVLLQHINFWVQVHNLPSRSMSEGMARQLGHGESFCPLRITLRSQVVEFGWDISLRVAPRRDLMNVSKWHREEQKEVVRSDLDLDETRRRRLIRSQEEEELNIMGGKSDEREVDRRFYRINKAHDAENRRGEIDTMHAMIIKDNGILEESLIDPVD
ncbi:hypothetical protein J1N35_002167 [Gossypium stocksii]|uniref:DUF4283 domain-containing protein n=1 Tax=Gossypium stocksii TaxID=47602 RepID=A0A9D4AN68_9ROSI|nr:hypothetical protein J1N35_002167 [Gossypium stocksii]